MYASSQSQDSVTATNASESTEYDQPHEFGRGTQFATDDLAPK